MICPKCGLYLYEKERHQTNVGTFFSIRCLNGKCDYFDYKTLNDEEALTLRKDLNGN